MTFKEQKHLIAYLMSGYNERRCHKTRNFYCAEPDLIEMIDAVLMRLDVDARRIITYDFIDIRTGYWWMEYYSRSTYYRLKRQAMEQFINCLHNGKML